MRTEGAGSLGVEGRRAREDPEARLPGNHLGGWREGDHWLRMQIVPMPCGGSCVPWGRGGEPGPFLQGQRKKDDACRQGARHLHRPPRGLRVAWTSPLVHQGPVEALQAAPRRHRALRGH